MPIHREHRGRYPVNWGELAFEIKDANHWQCQACGKPCRQPGEPFDTHRRTLTVAHLDGVYDRAWVQLAPLCSCCHLRHDARRRRRRMGDE